MKKIIILTCIIITLSGCLSLLDIGEGEPSIEYDNQTVSITNIPEEVEAIELETLYIGQESFTNNSVEISTSNIEEGDHTVYFITEEENRSLKEISVREQTERDSMDDNVQDDADDSKDLILNKPEDYESKWIIVDQNNDNNYNSIQRAINDAYNNQKIIVNSGNYEENIIIDKDLNLTSVGDVKITGSQNEVGIQIKDEADVNIDGFEISGFNIGILIEDTSGELDLKNIMLQENNRGLWADGSLYSWQMDQSIIKNNEIVGLVAEDFYGTWEVRNTIIRDNNHGVRIRDDNNDWYMEKVSVRNNNNINFIATDMQNSPTVEDSWIDEHEGEFRELNQCDTVDCGDSIIKPQDRTENYYLDYEVPQLIKVPNDFNSLTEAVDQSTSQDLIVLKEDIEENVQINKNDIAITGNESKPVISSEDECLEINEVENVKIQNIQLSNCNIGIDSSSNLEIMFKEMEITGNTYGVNLLQSNGEITFKNSRITNNQNEDVFVSQMTSPTDQTDFVKIKNSELGNVRAGNHNININLLYNSIQGTVETDQDSVVNANANYWVNGFSEDRKSGYVLHGQTCETPECKMYRSQR